MSNLDTILALPKVTHDLVQGTDEWSAFRLQHDGASEAAAMLGLSKNVSRTELLHAKHTSLPREFSDFVQKRVLDKGHEIEAMARPIIEARINTDLYPATYSRGRLSASCDGITLDDLFVMEHKQWNNELAASVRAGTLPDEHMPQCQQIMLVTGAHEVEFVVSDGTPERMVSMLVNPDRAWWERLVAGWAQFHADLAEYKPTEAAPAAVGHAPESLPALRIEVTGMVTASNLDAFRSHALAVFKGINRDLTTDTEFADAEKTVKWCGEVEDRLKAAKQHALSQTESIDALFRTIDEISAEAKLVRLELDKLVKARKEAIRGEIVKAGADALAAHMAALNSRLGKPYLPLIAADFAGKIKGLKTVASIRDAVASELARAKIHASSEADRIDANLKYLREHAAEYVTLFPDTASIVLKAPDDLQALVTARIVEAKAAEEKRLEAERERIRKEEEAKAERVQVNLNNLKAYRPSDTESSSWHRERIEALKDEPLTTAIYAGRLEEAKRLHEQLVNDLVEACQAAVESEAEARQAAEAAKPAPTPAPAVIAAPASVSPAVNVVPMAARTPKTPPALRLGQIGERLGFNLSADFLRSLGFDAAARDRSAVLYHEADFSRICAALVEHVNAVAAGEPIAA